MKTYKFRDLIDADIAVYAVDFLSQPDTTLVKRKPFVSKKTERVLPMAKTSDIVIVTESVNKQYYEWLRSVDLGTDNIFELNASKGTPLMTAIINNSNINSLKNYIHSFYGTKKFVPLMTVNDEPLVAHSLDLELLGGNPVTTLKYYNKSSFKEVVAKANLPVLRSELIYSNNDFDSLLKNYVNDFGSLIVKPVSASAGGDTYFVDKNNIKKIVSLISNKGDFLAEEYFNKDFETNDQWFIDKRGDIYFLGFSKQIIVNNSHIGNDYSIHNKDGLSSLESSLVVANLMKNEGYVGVFGLDYLHNDFSHFLIENNARFNGSTFTRGIIDRTGKDFSTWKTRAIKTNPMTFNELKDLTKDVLYTGSDADASFIPYDISLLDTNGSFIGLFVGSNSESINLLYNDVSSRL
ncbi:hypothetical protein KO361_01885 [Candidatus Woesearchaeota archaeon]|nr:hypothetical protein [Candidatus Woesearchaeota archaeon]